MIIPISKSWPLWQASGFLSNEELRELREHTKDCAECRKAGEEFTSLVCSGLPQTVSSVREFVDITKRCLITASARDSYDVQGPKVSCSPQESKN